MEMGQKLKSVMGNTNELIAKVTTTRVRGSAAASEVLFHSNSIDAHDARGSALGSAGYTEGARS